MARITTPRVRIVSEGVTGKTKVYVNDQDVSSDVIAVSWSLRANGGHATATVEFWCAAIEAEGELVLTPEPVERRAKVGPGQEG